MMETNQTSKFGRAVEFREIMLEAERVPFKCFEKWPIFEVWKKCLKEIREQGVLYEPQADWAEKWINTLLESNENRDIREELLSWYVLTARGQLAVRAINFALSLRRGFKIWPEELSKIITKRLIKHVDNEGFLYWPQLSCIKEFLHELLDDFKKERKEGYLDHTWYCAERALRIIVAAKDFSFLDNIEEMIVLIQSGQLFPRKGSEPFYVKASNLEVFKQARRILVRAKNEYIKVHLNKSSQA